MWPIDICVIVYAQMYFPRLLQGELLLGILCTRAFFMISNKFWMGGGGGESSAVMLLNCTGGGWALKPPMCLCTWNYLCTYDIYGPVRAASIIWASGRGLGPGILDFFGPQMTLAYWLDAISQGPKMSRFPGPSPLQFAPVMDAARIKSITHRAF